MEIVREIHIERPPDEVFAFVAEPRNDPRWCRKVQSVERIDDDRYRVVHKPVPLRPAREMDYRLLESDPPRRLRWREDDGTDVFHVAYELSSADGGGTRFVQRSEAELGAPRLLHPLLNAGIGRDIARQLGSLKRLLESPGGR